MRGFVLEESFHFCWTSWSQLIIADHSWPKLITANHSWSQLISADEFLWLNHISRYLNALCEKPLNKWHLEFASPSGDYSNCLCLSLPFLIVNLLFLQNTFWSYNILVSFITIFLYWDCLPRQASDWNVYFLILVTKFNH